MTEFFKFFLRITQYDVDFKSKKVSTLSAPFSRQWPVVERLVLICVVFTYVLIASRFSSEFFSLGTRPSTFGRIGGQQWEQNGISTTTWLLTGADKVFKLWHTSKPPNGIPPYPVTRIVCVVTRKDADAAKFRKVQFPIS